MAHPRSRLETNAQLLVALGLLALSLAAAGCQPGTICDKGEEYETLCNRGGAGGGGSGGQGGTGGGGAGGMGGMGGMAPPVSASTVVMNCAAFDTVGKMDQFFAMRCGPEGSTCHTPMYATVWKDFRTAKVWERMSDPMLMTSACRGAKIIDVANWQNSLMLLKIKDPPTCPPGSTTAVGLRMPPPNMPPNMGPLNDDETRCLENYLRAVARVP